MKILTKIKRRADGDELPKRGHLVEMELYDTDRNPLKFPTGKVGTVIDFSDLSNTAHTVSRDDDPLATPGTAQLTSVAFTVDGVSAMIPWYSGHFHTTSAPSGVMLFEWFYLSDPSDSSIPAGASGALWTTVPVEVGYYTSQVGTYGPGVLFIGPGTWKLGYYAAYQGADGVGTVDQISVGALILPGADVHDSAWGGTPL